MGLVWLALAVGAGASGLTGRLRPPQPQFVLASLTAGLILAGFLSTPFRRWLLGVDWRAIVALHLSRFIGIYFIWLYGHDQLPRAFAVPAGLGDILVATLASVLLLRHRAADRPPGSLRAWNLLGLVDLLFVVATATRLARANPLSMAELVRLPLCLLPTFLVPILLASHVLLGVRYRSFGTATMGHQ